MSTCDCIAKLTLTPLFNLDITGHIIGPSGVRALPLAAGTNEGGHYFRYIFHFLSYLIFFFFLLPPLFKTTEGVVVGFQIFACGPELPIE